MKADSKPFIHFAFGSEIFQDGPTEYNKFIKYLPENTPIFFSNKYIKVLCKADAQSRLKFIPILSTLRNSSKTIMDIKLSQIDAIGNVISQYYCPNNPKVENFVKNEVLSTIKYQSIAGIQLDWLEMPGCYCSFCRALAEGQGFSLKEISRELRQKRTYSLVEEFRMQSITNFAGKLMVLIREINPNLLLGLNLNFSKTPQSFGHDYFFLALYLDRLNFILDPTNSQEKDMLHQIKVIKTITKKFLGKIEIFLQVLLSDQFESDMINKIIRTTRKNAFDGVVFHISTLAGLRKWEDMALT